MLAWITIGVCIGFLGGMIVGYVSFSPKFEK